MCHHVDMDIDWEKAVTEESSDSLTDSADAEADEPELDAERSPEIAPPADD